MMGQDSHKTERILFKMKAGQGGQWQKRDEMNRPSRPILAEANSGKNVGTQRVGHRGRRKNGPEGTVPPVPLAAAGETLSVPLA